MITSSQFRTEELSLPERLSWILPSQIDVTDAFVDYARPHIGED
ncbi:MAG: hypothetical protein ACLP7Q_08295 [Isosphaeraceae bacterium]